MIAIVDYGSGNLRSVVRAAEAAAHRAGLSLPVELVSRPEGLRKAERVIFPGQGAMPDCMASLRASGLHEALLESLASKPFLGICVGQQMLFERSEEGDTPGLGIFKGEVVRFSAERGAVRADAAPLKVPHMGWNLVRTSRPHPVLQDLDRVHNGHWFYFVHSYHAAPLNPTDVLAESQYGKWFACAVARDNIVATQFHPEKSAAAGQQLLVNFLKWKPS